MALREYFANRWLNMIVLTLLVLPFIAPEYIAWDPQLGPVAGLLPIAAWFLGVNYERSIILEAKLVDEEELRTVERKRASMWER
jgi:hypothetical protein